MLPKRDDREQGTVTNTLWYNRIFTYNTVIWPIWKWVHTNCRTVQCPGAGLSDWIVLSVHTVCIKSVCVCVCLQKKSLGSVLYRAGFAVSVSANIAFILTQSSSAMPSSAFVFVNHHTSATTVSLIIIPRWKQALDETPPLHPTHPDPFFHLHYFTLVADFTPACLFVWHFNQEGHTQCRV